MTIRICSDPVEGVKAGLRNARAKGKRLGRPRLMVDRARIAHFRAQGFGWKRIAREMGVGVSTVLRVAQEGSQRGSIIALETTRPTPAVSVAACAD